MLSNYTMFEISDLYKSGDKGIKSALKRIMNNNPEHGKKTRIAKYLKLYEK